MSALHTGWSKLSCASKGKTEVTGGWPTGYIRAVRTSRGRSPPRVVLAGGSCPRVARGLGLRLPMQPASVSLRSTSSASWPRVPASLTYLSLCTLLV